MIANPNRCGCFVTSVVSPCDGPTDDCCLTICNILTTKTVHPCDDSGQLDITKYIKIPTCCNVADIELSIKEISNNLKNVTFTKVASTYLIDFESNYSTGKDYKSAKIVYQVKCGILKLQATIIIPFLQLDEDIVCAGGYDPCTGLCIPVPNEIIISGSINNEIKIY